MKHLLNLKEFDKNKIDELIKLAKDMKTNKDKYRNKLKDKVLLMLFEKPSLRTRLSFDVAIHELGGHGITLDAGATPLGEKESLSDTAKVSSRYVDCIMARMFLQSGLEEMAENSTVPVINGLTNDYHPVQILCDLLTISEKKGKLAGLKLAYLGDAKNNVTHSILIGCSICGMDVSVACPNEMSPDENIIKFAEKKGVKITVTDKVDEAVKDADVIYTDSWLSYHIKKNEKDERVTKLKKFQVNAKNVALAKKDYLFMHCLPAMRGLEVSADVIDKENSVVFDQAENRLHMQKAILLELMKQ